MRLLTMLGLWAVAAWHRLRVLDHAVVGSDSLGPYLQAQAALFGNLPRPPNPESGDALWLTMVSMVAAADSLVELFFFRFRSAGWWLRLDLRRLTIGLRRPVRLSEDGLRP
jgi:hypothetical protein